MPIRDFGFREIFKTYPKDIVEEFIKYHRVNGGLSRFHKIKYFYNEILGQEISEEKIQVYASSFTAIMKEELVSSKYLIDESVEFIKQNHKNYRFHIVSGSEHHELNFICERLGLAKYFLSINGSPTPKNELVKNLLEKNQYKKEETILIGDSINDYEAAHVNGLEFYGFNNIKLKDLPGSYINSYTDLEFNTYYTFANPIKVIVTKPLQYLIARQLVEEQKYKKVHLYLVPHFSNYHDFLALIKEDMIWSSIYTFKSKVLAITYKFWNYSLLVTNSDIGKDDYINSIFMGKTIIYEEGWGTYLNNVLITESKLKSLVYNILRFNKKYGNGYFTSKIFCYRPEILNRKKRIYPFNKTMSEYLISEASNFNFFLKNKKYNFDVLFLLGKDSKLNEKMLEVASNLVSSKIAIKFHPHFTYKNESNNNTSYQLLDNSDLVEIIILEFIRKRKKMVIYHDNSSISYYFKNLEIVKFINLGPNIPDVRKLL